MKSWYLDLLKGNYTICVMKLVDSLKKSLHHIDKNRLIAAPDCGLGILGRELAIKKMKNMSIAAHSL